MLPNPRIDMSASEDRYLHRDQTAVTDMILQEVEVNGLEQGDSSTSAPARLYL